MQSVSGRNGVMRLVSRTIAAGFLLFGFTLVAGCGSKPAPPAPNVELTPDPKPEPQPAPTVVATWELDVTKHVVPTTLVVAQLGGERLTPEVVIEAGQLVFRKPEMAPGDPWRVAITLPPEALKGEPIQLVIPDDRVPGPNVTIDFPKPFELAKYATREPGTERKPSGWEIPTRSMNWVGGCALTLDLKKRVEGKVQGHINLALPIMETKADPDQRNFLAGTFVASFLRQPIDPPAPEDVPFVNGAVTVTGANSEATLMVGYAAHPSPEVFPLGDAEIRLGEPVDPPRWTSTTHDTPRISHLIAGDGKMVPSRFEHNRLTPGRYLIMAGLRDGPAAWKWMNVTPNSTTTVNLSIDATQTGGLEVTAPLEALGKVQLAPADDPGQPPISSSLFVGISLLLRLEQDIAARKALFKNLAPGRYEVRAGGQLRTVEIVAGKVAELDFDKKAPEPKKPTEAAPEPKPKG